MLSGCSERLDCLPTVVPAECMVYTNPVFASRRCTSATSVDTDAWPVPIGTIQKSVAGGLVMYLTSSLKRMYRVGVRYLLCNEAVSEKTLPSCRVSSTIMFVQISSGLDFGVIQGDSRRSVHSCLASASRDPEILGARAWKRESLNQWNVSLVLG